MGVGVLPDRTKIPHHEPSTNRPPTRRGPCRQHSAPVTPTLPQHILESATVEELAALLATLTAAVEGWHLQPKQLEAVRLADECDELADEISSMEWPGMFG